MDSLTFNPEAINWGADWWKLFIIAFSALLLVYLFIRLALYVLRMVGVVVCLAVGILGGYTAQAFNEQVSTYFPDNVVRFTPIATALAGFIVCYCISMFIMMIIRKPAQSQASKEKS